MLENSTLLICHHTDILYKYSLLGTVDELVFVAALVRTLHALVLPQRLRVLVELRWVVEVWLRRHILEHHHTWLHDEQIITFDRWHIGEPRVVFQEGSESGP